MLKEKEIIECIAEVQHNYWIHIVTNLSTNGVALPDDLEKKWKKRLLFYKNLSEEDKEKDRMWAHIILEEIRPYMITKRFSLHGVYDDSFDKKRILLEQRIIDLEQEKKELEVKLKDKNLNY
jgi:hypothetical protein